MASVPASFVERLASHSLAGPSCSGGRGTTTSYYGYCRGHQRRASRVQQQVSAPLEAGPQGRHGSGWARVRRRAVLTTCQALQAADYSFYQRLRDGEVTEDYLWETRLLPLLGYLTADETTSVREALSLAYDAHSGQKRKSGEPFITHPVEVSRILAELRMDYESLVAGLLHDTVEDCGDVVGLDEIDFHFGAAVRRIVEGETKFSKLPTHHPEDRNTLAGLNGSLGVTCAAPNGSADGATGNGLGGRAVDIVAASGGAAGVVDPKAQDLQFLFLAMTEEVRIIVVKLADRLHNMRTMASMPPSKQRRIAQETLQVFAPLARLLGLYSIKEELEELSFKYALPAQYDAMRRSVARLWESQQPVVEAARRELQDRLECDPYLLARVSGVRVDVCRKALYSTWRKLNDAGKSAREIGDIAQLRVVLTPRYASAPAGSAAANGAAAAGALAPAPVPLDYGSEKQLCYHIMGLVHTFWAPIPGSMKDYIATPKPNNYQSLHTTVVPTGLDVAAALENGAAPGPAFRRKASLQLLFPIEVQIRTQAMDRLAENGIAVESWTCADYGRRFAGAGSGPEDSYLDSAFGSITASTNVSYGSGNDSGWEEEAGANGNGKAGGGSGSGARFPFNLGMLVSSLAGNGAVPSANGSSNGNGNGSANGSSNGSSNGRAALAGREGGAALSVGSAGGEGGVDPQVLSRRINWLKSIREWQSEFVGTLTASEFVECVTDDLLGQSVFVFTPSGEVVRLPKGATVIDFAYHIHTELGNTMVAAKVNGKVVNADHELANAEVVEVVRYKGPVNATIIRRHQQWLDAAQTRTARHKIAKFLRQHAALAVSKGLLPPGDSTLASTSAAGTGSDCDERQVTWLVMNCDDRPGLLAEVANCIARHDHNITAYSGSLDVDAGLFVMEYELDGRPSQLTSLCEELNCIESVSSWAAGCALPEQQQRLSRI